MGELSDLTIGIIGGAGRMGSFFLNELHKLGYKRLLFSDVDDGKASKLEPQFERASSNDLAARCDITIVSVPIPEIPKVSEVISPYIKKGAIASHFGSIQKPGLEALASREGYDIIGVHPMFSNTVKSMEGRKIAILPYRNNGWLEILQKVLEPTKADLRIINPEKHDRIMICEQTLLQFNTFVLTHVLRQYAKDHGIERADLDLLETPNLLLNRIIMGRIFNTGNASLYADIQMENPAVLEMLSIYKESFDKLSGFVKDKKKEYFINLFGKLEKYFGVIHKTWSANASDEIIDYLGKMRSYVFAVHEREEAVKNYCSNEYKQRLKEAECIGKQFTHPKLKKVGDKFLAIEGRIRSEEYEKAREAAGSLMHSARQAKSYFKIGYDGVMGASEEFMSRCILLLEAIKELRPYSRRNENS